MIFLVSFIDDSDCSIELKPITKKRQALTAYNLPNKVSLLYENNSMFVSKIFSKSSSSNKENANECRESVSFHESSFFSSYESSYLSETSTEEEKISSPMPIERRSNHFIYTSNLWCRRQLNISQEEVISNVNMQRVVNNIPQCDNLLKSDAQNVNM